MRSEPSRVARGPYRSAPMNCAERRVDKH
jgi:hypothetical protein